jgi:nuclear GTP-binding protein
VIIEVLDARDPMGSRAAAVEATVAANPNKKLVLVLNKVDLVPRGVVAGWLSVLRRSHPTVAFKASTQSHVTRTAGGKLNSSAETAEAAILQRSFAVGTESLMGVLKNYCRGDEGGGGGGGGGSLKMSIVVGVIG